MDDILEKIIKYRGSKSLATIAQYKVFINSFCKFNKINYENILKGNPKINIDDDLIFKFVTSSKDPRLFFMRNILFIFYNQELDIQEIKNKIIEKKRFEPKKNKIDKSNKYLSVQELELIYNNIDEYERLIFLFFVTTGMRRSAYLNLTKDKININKRYYETIEKDGKLVKYFLTVEIIFLYKKYYRRLLRMNTVHYLSLFLDKLSSIINKKIHPHLFRHTYARIIFNYTNSLEYTQTTLSHTNIKNTKYYIKENHYDLSKRLRFPWLTFSDEELKLIPFFMLKPHIEYFENLCNKKNNI